jgi:putative Ca2+/H+ antiporter (TMEM165/GDT1 family)
LRVSAFFISFAVIFAAELGDKSQLVALWFATRYRWWLVLAGVTVATLVVHLGSVFIGRAFDEVLPERVLLVIVALSFFGFAAWSLAGDTLNEDSVLRVAPLGAFGVVTVSFFISELGDKTQLATVALGGERSDALGVWLGSTAGMVVADALAITAGVLLGRRLPLRLLSKLAAVLFVFFGVLILVRAFA